MEPKIYYIWTKARNAKVCWLKTVFKKEDTWKDVFYVYSPTNFHRTFRMCSQHVLYSALKKHKKLIHAFDYTNSMFQLYEWVYFSTLN